MRFFRAASDATYEGVRLSLDAAWGHPKPGAVTCFDPAAVAPRDSRGRLVLAVSDAFCEMDHAAAVLPDLISSGAVTEIDAAAYWDGRDGV